VLDRDLRAEGWPNRNWHVIDCDDIESLYACWRHGQLPSQQWTFVTPTSLKDPTNPRLCHPGQTNLQLVTGAPASHSFWNVGPRFQRGERYAHLKRALADRAVRHAERAIPGLADTIAFQEAATPITLERYLGASGGTSYGIAGTPTQIGLLRPGPTTPIDGLYLAGASARSGHGVTYAMLGGTEAASAITGHNVLQQLTAPRPSPARIAPAIPD
jgi:all-trans-retinol 13,14-reductase